MAKDDLLTSPAVAEILGVSDETIRRWADAGKLTYLLLPSGQRRFRRTDVEAFLVPVVPEPTA